MKLLKQILNKNKRGTIGLEFEFEGVNDNYNIKELNSKYPVQKWNKVKDGSLRNGSFELVLKEPVGFTTSKKLVKDLYEWIGCCGGFTPSIRTSTHVHLNVLKRNINEVMKIIYLYYRLEPYLMDLLPEERKENFYSLPLEYAEGPIIRLISYCDSFIKLKYKLYDIKFISSLNNDRRYSSLNLCSIPKYGSLEFRMFHLEKDVSKVIRWIEIIKVINDIAIKHSTEEVLNKDIKEILKWIGVKPLSKKYHSNDNLLKLLNVKFNIATCGMYNDQNSQLQQEKQECENFTETVRPSSQRTISSRSYYFN